MGSTSIRRHLRSAGVTACMSTRDNARMEILLNGEPRTVADACRVSELLQAEGLGGRRVAVEVNGTIVPRGAHAGHVLRSGDRVEIVHALGGG